MRQSNVGNMKFRLIYYFEKSHLWKGSREANESTTFQNTMTTVLKNKKYQKFTKKNKKKQEKNFCFLTSRTSLFKWHKAIEV